MKRDMNALEHDDDNTPPYITRSTEVPTPRQRMDNFQAIHRIFANLDVQFKKEFEVAE